MNFYIKNKFKKLGFTLIELLLVISIIALLSSIVLSSMNDARDRAQVAAYRSYLKQYINALELYRSDNNGNYPPFIQDELDFAPENDRSVFYFGDSDIIEGGYFDVDNTLSDIFHYDEISNLIKEQENPKIFPGVAIIVDPKNNQDFIVGNEYNNSPPYTCGNSNQSDSEPYIIVLISVKDGLDLPRLYSSGGTQVDDNSVSINDEYPRFYCASLKAS